MSSHSAMAVLSAVFVMQVINALPWPDGVIPTVGRHTAAAIVVTCLILLYSASRSARSAVSLLAVFPVAVVALFLFNSRSVWDPQAVNAVTLESLLGVNSAADVPEHDHTGPAQNASERSVHALERLNDRFPPIYILVIDELPWASLLDEDGNIDAFRYPNFARLAGTSHIFANASTTSAYSLQAIPGHPHGHAPNARNTQVRFLCRHSRQPVHDAGRCIRHHRLGVRYQVVPAVSLQLCTSRGNRRSARN